MTRGRIRWCICRRCTTTIGRFGRISARLAWHFPQASHLSERGKSLKVQAWDVRKSRHSTSSASTTVTRSEWTGALVIAMSMSVSTMLMATMPSLTWNVRSWATAGTGKMLRSRHMALDITMDISLHLVSRVLSEAPISRRCTSFTTQPDILVVANSFFRKSVEVRLLMLSCSVDPGVHIFHHVSLDFGICVVEIGVEPMFDKVRRI